MKQTSKQTDKKTKKKPTHSEVAVVSQAVEPVPNSTEETLTDETHAPTAETAKNTPLPIFNRELSWLEFNERVLEEAWDKTNPHLERLKFLAISASNLDEFFMVRVSGLAEQAHARKNLRDPSGLTAAEQLDRISERVHTMSGRQYNCLSRSILPLVAREGLTFVSPEELSALQQVFVKRYFEQTIFPVLTPMAIDPGRPFPLLANKSLNLIISLEHPEAEMYAVVQVPSKLPRFIELPSGGNPGRQFILAEDIIKRFAQLLFSGYIVNDAYAFRITRDADLAIDEKDADDLMEEIENSVRNRKWGQPVRLEIERATPRNPRTFLIEATEVEARDIYEISGPLDLTFLFAFSGLRGAEHMRFGERPPVPAAAFVERDPFEVIREGDVLVYHPYQSFDCVTNFVRTAAADENCLAIKQTLYRVSGNSPIISALIAAAENGKQVTVLVELKARFDEENNIHWARKLEQAGCHVIYGLVGLKTHCKICLVVRRDEDGIRRYIHLGTGNYNDSTAKIYTDYSLFTCRETLGRDVTSLFNLLTGYSKQNSWNKLAVAPLTLRRQLLELIRHEQSIAESGGEGHIIGKMNSLVDVEIINALYAAAKAGVKIDLIVRGICCLRPGVLGLSENIRVVSIVGRYLEHSRVYYFGNAGNPRLYLASADWMPRNLDRRVEVMFPIDDEALRARIMEDIGLILADTEKQRILQPDGSYTRVDRRGREHVDSQSEFYERAKAQFRAEE